MRETKNSKKKILYPDDPFRKKWDLFITLLLLFTCTATPYRIAVEETTTDIDVAWAIIDNLVDFFFFIDIILNFFMAYYNSEYKLIEDRRTIAISYLKSWFIIDVIAILPIDYILRTGEYN